MTYVPSNKIVTSRRRPRAMGALGGVFDFDDPTLTFNSTKFPGICKPMDKATLDVVVIFQNNLNRVAQMKGFSKIAPDGDIGPATLALFRSVQAASGGSVAGNGSSCVGIGPDLNDINRQVAALADSLGAPAKVSGPAPIAPPSFVTPTGQTVAVPNAGAGSIFDVVKNMSTPMKLTLAGLGVGIGYFAFFATNRARRARR